MIVVMMYARPSLACEEQVRSKVRFGCWGLWGFFYPNTQQPETLCNFVTCEVHLVDKHCKESKSLEKGCDML